MGSFAKTYTSRGFFVICSVRLTQLGGPFRTRWAITAVQFSSLGTTAIGIDGGQSSNDDSFSRKIQIGSVLEILVFANGKRRLIGSRANTLHGPAAANVRTEVRSKTEFNGRTEAAFRCSP